MSSASKFSHGLNNWAGTDKPTRTDFVNDNEIVNDDVMWKEDYDATGAVLQAGGIENFAMSQTAYDPQGVVAQTTGGIPGYVLPKQAYDADGSVALEGGIAAAIDNAVQTMGGFSLFEHGKVGTLHHLTGVGQNIKFVATASFSLGDTIQVNGTAMNLRIQGTTAALPANYWLEGDVVICTVSGDRLTFYAPGEALRVATAAQTTAAAAMPKSGGTFTGDVGARSANRAGWCVRNCGVRNSAGAEQSTNVLLFYRR